MKKSSYIPKFWIIYNIMKSINHTHTSNRKIGYKVIDFKQLFMNFETLCSIPLIWIIMHNFIYILNKKKFLYKYYIFQIIQ